MKNRIEIEFKNGELAVYNNCHLRIYSDRVYITDNGSLDETLSLADINSLEVRESDEDIS